MKLLELANQTNHSLSIPPLQKSIIFHKVYDALVKNINCHYILSKKKIIPM